MGNSKASHEIVKGRGAFICLAVVSAVITGCGTISDLQHPRHIPAGTYGGVRLDSEAIDYTVSHERAYPLYKWVDSTMVGPLLIVPVAGMDMVMCAIADTLVLPYTLSRSQELHKK